MAPEVILQALIALPFAVAFAVSAALAPGIIGMLKRRGAGQVISQDGPQSHLAKQGTPTMGGLIILAGTFAGCLAAVVASRNPKWVLNTGALTRHSDLAAVLYLATGYALIGMLDDYLTIRQPAGIRGIPSKPKALMQAVLAALFLTWLAFGRTEGFVPVLVVGGHQILSGVWYWVFACAFIVGMTNFVNISDGLDGLAAGLAALAAMVLVCCAIMLPWGVRSECDLTLYGLLPAVAGACTAFLWFNAHPAKVFMGDTGSLAIGASLSAAAIVAHKEALLVVIGFVFVLEGLSTAVQWAVFKFTRITTGTGRRVFRKSPLHHHYELSGWPEPMVVARFWILGVLASVAGFAGAVWRIW
ncbi:MAG: phospho-N-acetylmuramoyl-pentapeptide-transferase [Armatimonadota bacterium]|nr:phospho-N-acetylmuramoyl-pentapeptide-transferase [Armatimonadota bacterium]